MTNGTQSISRERVATMLAKRHGRAPTRKEVDAQLNAMRAAGVRSRAAAPLAKANPKPTPKRSRVSLADREARAAARRDVTQLRAQLGREPTTADIVGLVERRTAELRADLGRSPSEVGRPTHDREALAIRMGARVAVPAVEDGPCTLTFGRRWVTPGEARSGAHAPASPPRRPSRLPPQERARLDARMGLGPNISTVTHRGNRVIFGGA